MIAKLAVLVVIAAAIAAIVHSFPDAKKYVNMQRM
jgi:hypothetical protein